ncbi:MAG TPA: LysR substrate-binding domain-containing protein [Pseudonocardiaceae bacterium]|nr:LysR substrate-binding domain-containing protein [Pseudonocardiaceae bacterium]
MEVRQLRYFLAVVEHGSVTKAATALRLAQPSLSQSLRSLERELGVELFHRTGRSLVLSAAGATLAGPARQVLRDIEAAAGAVQEVRELRTGQLTIATLATLAVDPVAELVGTFRTRHPGIVIHLAAPEDALDVGRLVRTGQCELGFAHVLMPDPDLVTIPLATQRVLAVLPPGSQPDTGRPLGLRQLATLSWVASPPGTSTRIMLDEGLATLGLAPGIAVQTPHRDAIVPLVLAGAGATLLPEELAHEAGRRGAVVCQTKPALSRRIAVVHRAAVLSPAAAAFLALLPVHSGAQHLNSAGRA